MIRNLLLTAFRSLKKNKFFSALNILGLSIGMAVFLLIALYVKFERSYEDFVPDRADIYRVKLEAWSNNEQILSTAENYPAAGPALKRELPEVVSFARLYNMGYKNNVVITYKDAKPEPIAFKQKRFLYADSAFLPMMGYVMAKGDASTALAAPLTAVVSEQYAALYFKKEDPIGKTLLLQDDDFNKEQVTVTGVFKDLPANTHLKFDVLFSYKTLFTRGANAAPRYDYSWQRNDMYTFIRLRANTDPATIESKLPGIVGKYMPGLQASGTRVSLGLQPLTAIHLTSELTNEAESNGSERIVTFITLIGVFILVIAWVNYINLSTARAVERAREVGVRKVIGAVKSQLVKQFLIEAAGVNLFSVILACIFVAFTLPSFNSISGLPLRYVHLAQPWFLVTLLLLWVTGTFFSGLYPALVLSSFKPIKVLKGKLKNTSSGIILRKGLVTMQFVASIVLIAGTIIVYRQLNFMMHRDIGMNIDQVMVIERPAIANTDRLVFNASIDHFKNELKQSSAVVASSASLTIPGKQREYKMFVKRTDQGRNDSVMVNINTTDYDFLDVFQMKLIAGRNFSPAFPADEDHSTIITASAARSLGFTNPADIIGHPILMPDFDNSTATVVGVVNDYHQLSLKKAMGPGFFMLAPHQGEMYSVRIRSQHIDKAIEDVRKAWTTTFAGNPFEYFFLDEYFNQQYSNERKFGKLFTIFSILAIIIGCLGLLGLSAYTANQRIKEIGIRKVLGASVTDIATMLSKDFVKLVGIAILVATPISWFIMNNWLQQFAYRINVGWWVFAVAGISALLIALITVSLQAVKAAIANPVKSLRTE